MRKIAMVFLLGAMMVGCGAQNLSTSRTNTIESYSFPRDERANGDPIDGIVGDDDLDVLRRACDGANAWQANQSHGFEARPGFRVYCD